MNGTCDATIHFRTAASHAAIGEGCWDSVAGTVLKDTVSPRAWASQLLESNFRLHAQAHEPRLTLKILTPA